MRLACLALALLLSACGSSAPLPPPVPEALPPPPARVPVEPQPEAEPEAPAPVAPVVAPPSPPPTPPRLSVRAQSVYPAVDLYEWTLSNGMTVVYKRVDAAGPLRLLAFAEGGWTALDAGDAALAVRSAPSATDDGLSLGATERQVRARAESARSLFQRLVDALSDRRPAPGQRTAVDALDPLEIELADASPDGVERPARSLLADPAELTAVVVGDVDPASVVAEAGRLLAGLPRAPDAWTFGPPRRSPARPSRVARRGDVGVLDLALRAPLGRAGRAGLDVLAIALEDALDRAGLGRLRVDAAPTPWTDAGWLRVEVESSDLDPDALAERVRSWLASPKLDLEAARAARLRQLAAPSADDWLAAVADLYREGGGERPGRNPAALDPLSRSVERLSLADLQALARRVAATEDAARILMP